jgi:hypothetical protein
MEKNTDEPAPGQVLTQQENGPYVLRSQKFLTGSTMVACSCGEVRVFPDARRGGKCPRGNPFVCMAQLGLPMLPASTTLE